MLKERFRKFLPVVVDLETGGFDSKKNAILEIAIQMIDEEDSRLILGESHRFHIEPFENLIVDKDALEFLKLDLNHPLRVAVEERFALQEIFKIINKQKNLQTFGNLSSLLHSFELGKKMGKDLVFFLEDDYIHFEPMLEEMIASYERISSQTKKELFICPADYPYLYMNNEKSNILIGNKRHWRTIDKTLCTFITSIELINKYWDNFYSTCLDRNEPFEKYLNEIYKKELCISPLKSLSVHMTNVNSNYGLSPFINYKKLWDEN